MYRARPSQECRYVYIRPSCRERPRAITKASARDGGYVVAVVVSRGIVVVVACWMF